MHAIARRLFCLNTVAAVAYGFSAVSALAWLGREQLDAELTEDERAFMNHGKGNPSAFQIQVEGMWALAWTLGIVSELDFWSPCRSDFVTVLPNLKVGEGVERTLRNVKARGGDAILAACDLSYCLHWRIREWLLVGEALPQGLDPHLVIERRRALEWVLGSDDWDVVNLDT